MRCLVVRTQLEGVHCYIGAPPEVDYLSLPHRHVFHIEVEIEVFKENRELELLSIKADLTQHLRAILGGRYLLPNDRSSHARVRCKSCLSKMFCLSQDIHSNSCEHFATAIQSYLKIRYPSEPPRRVSVRVLEDGENGCYLREV